jgi:transcriptional regulator with XRE-family HTH domain
MARCGAIAQQTISAVLTRRLQPGAHALTGIAKALDLPLNYITEQANQQLPKPERPLITRIIKFLELLPDEDLEAILHILRRMKQG